MTTDHPDALAGVLGTTLHCIQAVVSSELAAIYDLREGRLEARSTVGSLTSLVIPPRPIELASHPEVQQALEDGTPLTSSAQVLLGQDAVPSAEHSCLLVPLRCGGKTLGALVLVGGGQAGVDMTAAIAASHGLTAALTMARRLEDASPLGTTLLPLRKAERLHLLGALKHTGGKIYGRDGAARLLDLKPTTLQSKLKKHGISRLDAVNGSTPSQGSPGSDREAKIDVGTIPRTIPPSGSEPVATPAAE